MAGTGVVRLEPHVGAVGLGTTGAAPCMGGVHREHLQDPGAGYMPSTKS